MLLNLRSSPTFCCRRDEEWGKICGMEFWKRPFRNDKKQKDFPNIWQHIMALQCTATTTFFGEHKIMKVKSFYLCKRQFFTHRNHGMANFERFLRCVRKEIDWTISSGGIMNWHVEVGDADADADSEKTYPYVEHLPHCDRMKLPCLMAVPSMCNIYCRYTLKGNQ